MKRRAFALGLFSLAGRASALGAELPHSEELELSALQLSGEKAFGRALLCVPRKLGPKPSLLVLLHGLGETHDQNIGARAFAERYGMLSAVARLTRPPLARTLPAQDYFGPGRLAELNATLAEHPYSAPVLLCPYTPNPYKDGTGTLVERYASFLTGPLLSEVEKRVGTSFPAERCMISGVSLGGYLALEVFLRRPERFCAVGSAQGAFGLGQAVRYAGELAAVSKRSGGRSIELLSSSFDPYRPAIELLKKQLAARKVPATLLVSPGPHDQRWLRESGVIEMLLGAARAFTAAGRGSAP